MAVMIGGPAANLCLLGCLFVVVVNTGTVPREKKLLTVCRLFMFVGVSVSEFPPSPSIPPLSFSLSRTTNKQTHIQTDKYRCTAVCTPLFMCTSVYACKKNKYHCLYVHETSTCIPLFMRAENKYKCTTTIEGESIAFELLDTRSTVSKS